MQKHLMQTSKTAPGSSGGGQALYEAKNVERWKEMESSPMFLSYYCDKHIWSKPNDQGSNIFLKMFSQNC